MKLSEDLVWRGLIKDKTFSDISWLDQPRVFYHGVDPSSDSLTIGNLAALLLARRLIDNGWKAILLVGGATSLIGDPGGKEAERELKSREEVQKNSLAIKKQINQLFAGQHFTPADNYDWFSGIKYLEFLRDVGKYFSMTELMQRDFVAERMNDGGSGISYAEFSYSLVQGYDYWMLHREHKAELQIGGSDQWGNMLSGVSLIRKKTNKEVNALSMPLILNKATGRKFGKSEEGTIWLDLNKTSFTQFKQFWINTDDSEVEHYLKIFTLATAEQIKQVMSDHKHKPELRVAQIFLSEQVSEIVHGKEAAADSNEIQDILTNPSNLKQASEELMQRLRIEIPAVKVNKSSSIIEALVRVGLASSNSDARRLLSSNAVYINSHPVNRDNFEDNDFIDRKLLLRRGKAYKDSALIELG